ncbi:hypothetical protein [Thalassotalea sp. ND16A]|uniref:hypothetical protein n=1 Tax=Thalassotalea sp. ND16A TaxID=1535422 RepID=UPI00051A1795|nr:hypothetical protein [Thalassotalea sp. ND16A]KGK01097.1 hypothetical protein ND16A_3104 [Thalassotalea sp. ND16A]
MKYTLSFGYINKVADNIAEVLVDNSATINNEMYAEYKDFLETHFTKPYAVLINSINEYYLTPEVKLQLAKSKELAGVATVSYTNKNNKVIDDFLQVRANDNINLKQFSAFEMGRNHAIRWLELELTKMSAKA